MNALNLARRIVPKNLWEYLWRRYLSAVQHTRAALFSPGITVTVLTGGLGIAPILFPLLKDHPDWAFIIAAIVFISLILVSGQIALRTADPETYARILVAGRPAKEVIFVTSWHILQACKRTLRIIDKGTDLASELERNLVDFNRDLSEEEAEKIDRLREDIQRHILAQHTLLLRIEQMKLSASKELGIPPRRLCDHVFQYSPMMHRNRLQNYLSIWEEVRDLRRVDDRVRFRSLLEQTHWFVNNTLRRRRCQRQLIQNRDLHPYIVQFASVHSTSGSLHTYAQSLKFVAATGVENLWAVRSKHKNIRNQIEEEITDRFLFIQRKQRAHPGFDLHTLLLQALQSVDMPEEPRSRVQSLLKALANDAPPAVRELVSEEMLASFSTLPASLARLVAASRNKIALDFKEVYDAWFKEIGGAKFVVSHGYSRTVLSVLRQVASGGTRMVQAPPRIFFVLPEDEDSFDTRVMEYELREERKLRPSRFAAGNQRHLLGLLSPGDAVLILLGAESFDQERRVVHPRGIVQRLSYIVENLRPGICCLVVVVAESYKRQASPLTDNTSFYSQHFDRIDLYPPQWIHLILTEKGSLPEDCLSVIHERLTQGGR